jgi:hypothetical protein
MAQKTFNEWRKDLSRNINSRLGVSMNKLPDFPLKEWWKDGISTKDAIDIIRDELGDEQEE